MTRFPGPEAHERFLRITISALLILLIFPTVVIASTPPVQPALTFTIQNLSGDQEFPLTLSLTGNRYDTFAIPPEHSIISVFFCSGWITAWIIPSLKKQDSSVHLQIPVNITHQSKVRISPRAHSCLLLRTRSREQPAAR